jgi:integrase
MGGSFSLPVTNVIGRTKSEAGAAHHLARPASAQCAQASSRARKAMFDPLFATAKGQHQKNIVRALGNVLIAAGVVVPVKDEHGRPRQGCGGQVYTPGGACMPVGASTTGADGGLELPAGRAGSFSGMCASIVMTMHAYEHLFPRSDDGTELAGPNGLCSACTRYKPDIRRSPSIYQWLEVDCKTAA